MNYGKSDERPKADINIQKLPIPTLDPVFGKGGPLSEYWKLLEYDGI